MPTYVYEVIQADGQGERFEVVQTMSDEPLTEHPETGEPVRRIILPPNIAGRWTDRRVEKNMADDKRLEKLGFTKYVKTETGRYEKTAGDGPKVIQKGQDGF